jgi:hypothetical protein
VKRSTREKIAAVFFALDNLSLVPTLCACRRPIPPQLPDHIKQLIDEARAALATEPETRIDYMDFD